MNSQHSKEISRAWIDYGKITTTNYLSKTTLSSLSQDSNLCLLVNNYRELSANHALARSLTSLAMQSLVCMLVELYTHHNSVKNIMESLSQYGFHLCTVHLVDSHYCSDPEEWKTTLSLSTPDQHSNRELLIIDSLVYCNNDSLDHLATKAGKFISTLLLSLSAMMQIELPHINVLSKVDLLAQYGDKLLFGLDYYTEVLDLNYLLEALDEDPLTRK
ncbi:unnamed protein product, partial [Timema podura]|nr:unnamed protein product [Timema podura]